MKKILFFAAMALTLVGCTEDYKDWTVQKPDTTPDAAIEVKATIEMATDIDFNTYTDGTFQLFTPSVTSSVTADSIRYEAYMYNADKSESLPLNIDEEGKIASSEVFTNVQTLFGKRPQTYNVPIEVICRVYAGKSTAKETATANMAVTLTAPFVAEAYYLIGDFNGWNGDALKDWKFKHSGQDVYEDPIFTITFETTADNQYWKIIPQTCIDAGGPWTIENDEKGVVGVAVDGDTSFSGTLITNQAKAGKLAAQGRYTMTIDMLDYTYTIKKLPDIETWYLVGSCIGDGSWGNAPENIGKALFPLAYIGNKTIQYTGYFTTDGFKLIKEPGSWDDQWGWKDGAFVKNDSGSGNLWVDTPGYYTVTLDFGNDVLTIEPAQAPTATYAVGMAGSFNGWSFEAMTPCTNNDHLWKFELNATSDVEGKFLIDGWSVNWGAETFPSGIGTQDGSNIPIEAGNYTVIFNDITGGYNFIAK